MITARIILAPGFNIKTLLKNWPSIFWMNRRTVPRRNQEGLYTSYTFGPVGKQVKILLLDNRYHAGLPGPEADLLGEKQWQWLVGELSNSRAQIHLLVSGIQVLHEEHRSEKWANFPKDRSRLFDLIKHLKTPGVILISGDRHIHEIAKKDDEETLLSLDRGHQQRTHSLLGR